MRFLSAATILGISLTGFAGQAQADVTQGSSSAYGLFVDVSIVDRITFANIGVDATLGPVPQASGTAPAPYSVTNTLAQASVTAGGLLTLGQGLINVDAATVDSTDILSASASSNVDGNPGVRNAHAEAFVDNLQVNATLVGLGSLTNTADLFDFGALLISSMADVTGDFGSLNATGDSVIIDANGVVDGMLSFTVLGTTFNVAVDAQGRVAPNTTLTIDASSDASFADSIGTDLTGSVTIVLNEQTFTGDGISDRAVEVNALRISFNEFGSTFFDAGINIDNTNLLNGEIIVSHTQASLQAIPEPSSLALLGLGGLTLLRRRR